LAETIWWVKQSSLLTKKFENATEKFLNAAGKEFTIEIMSEVISYFIRVIVENCNPQSYIKRRISHASNSTELSSEITSAKIMHRISHVSNLILVFDVCKLRLLI